MITNKPQPRKSKVVLRDLGTRGVKETDHTSFRLKNEDRILLAKIAHKDGDVPKSVVLRRLIRKEAEQRGIKI